MAHPGEAAIQLEAQDARTGRRCRDEGDRLSHSVPKTSAPRLPDPHRRTDRDDHQHRVDHLERGIVVRIEHDPATADEPVTDRPPDQDRQDPIPSGSTKRDHGQRDEDDDHPEAPGSPPGRQRIVRHDVAGARRPQEDGPADQDAERRPGAETVEHDQNRPSWVSSTVRAWPVQRRSSMNAHRRRWIAEGPSPASAALWRGHGYPLFPAKAYAG